MLSEAASEFVTLLHGRTSMPEIIPCPGCDKKIKVPDGAEGKKLKCPGCQAILLITEDGLEEVKKQGVQASVKKPAAKPPPEEDEDAPTKAKRRKPADEDEVKDQPKAKRRNAAVDDEDEPKSKRRNAAVDDEDEPDEEEDERPLKKKRKKAGKGIPMWVWLAGGGGLAAVLVVVLILFVFSGGSSNLSKVKSGMTEREVIALAGNPQLKKGSVALWTHPKKSEAELSGRTPPSGLKEALMVIFVDSKATEVEYRQGAAIYEEGKRR